MGLRINTNTNALTALGNLRQTDKSLSKSLERLSTGLRINKASDDPSGLVISEQFRAQIASLNQAIENTQFDSNLIGTAEAALQEISDLLIGIRESAIFAQNTGGVSDEQIEAEQDAVDSAISAIDRISATTRFGRRNLLNGDANFVQSAGGLGGGSGISNLIIRSIFLPGTSQALFTAQVTQAASQATLTIASIGGVVASGGGGTGQAVVIRITGEKGTQTITFESTATTTQIRTAINAVRDFTGVYASGFSAFSETFGADTAVQLQLIDGQSDGAGGGFLGASDSARDEGRDARVVVAGAQTEVKGLEVRVQSPFLKAEFTVVASAYSQRFGVTDFSGLVFQLGGEPQAIDQIRVGLSPVDSSRLGFGEIAEPRTAAAANQRTVGGFLNSVTAGGENDLRTDPTNAIRIADRALDIVNGLRGFLGAVQSDTLEPNERSLSVAVENLTASESEIRDLDFAAETASFTRNQILFQAGTAVLGAANLVPQQVLTLLGV